MSLLGIRLDVSYPGRCRVFAQQGCKVYASARRVESLQEYEGLDVVKIALDVTSDESVKRAVDEIIEREGRLDVLVNNAGMIAPGPSFPFRRGSS